MARPRVTARHRLTVRARRTARPRATPRPDAGDAGVDSAAVDAASGDTSSAADAARDAAAADTGPPPIGVIAGRITMSDLTNFTSRGSGVAGVLVTLTGPSARTAISDANGAFQFPEHRARHVHRRGEPRTARR